MPYRQGNVWNADNYYYSVTNKISVEPAGYVIIIIIIEPVKRLFAKEVIRAVVIEVRQ